VPTLFLQIILGAEFSSDFGATVQGWLNANAWGSTVVLVLLLLGAAYQLSIGARRQRKPR
jgi:hypothetical protein